MLFNTDYPEISPFIDNESDIYEELPDTEDSPLRTKNA